jgi:hypothetical protein
MSSIKVWVSARMAFSQSSDVAVARVLRNCDGALAAAAHRIKIEFRSQSVKSHMRKVLAASAVLFVLAAGSAQAASNRETLEAFGFFGSWAENCAGPATPSNNHRTAFVSPAGHPTFTEILGPESEPNVYVILRARRVSGDVIRLRIRLNGEIVQDLTMRRDHGRLRTMTNRDAAGGALVVKNGIVTANGRQTPWLTHCPGKP